MAPFSNLDLIKAVDAFPYDQDEYIRLFKEPLYTLLHRISDSEDVALGFMLPSVVKALESIPETIRGHVVVDTKAHTIRAFDLPTEVKRTKVVNAVMKYWKERGTFKILGAWNGELWPVYASNDKTLLYSVERAGAGLLGVTRYGVHMTAYVKDETTKHGIKIWVPKRAMTKKNYPGMLDNTVAGGMATEEVPSKCIVREADEEASLPEKLTREKCKEVGITTYIYITDERAGGEKGLIYPETQWIYDIELPADVIPKPKDGEAEKFDLLTVEQIQAEMAKGSFKPNCALVLINFFLRKGILTEENEPDIEEIIQRMHRKIPFPGPHHTEAQSISQQ